MSEEFHGVAAELGDAGPCPSVTLGKKTWKVGWPTQRAKAELEGLVYECAKRNVEAVRGRMSAAEYAEEKAALRKALHGGLYATWGELWVAVNSGPDANNLFLLSLLREHHPEAAWDDAGRLWGEAAEDVKDAMARVVPGFYAILVATMPGTPESRAAYLAQSVANYLTEINRLPPRSPGGSSAASTS